MHDRQRTLMLPVTLPEDLPVLETKELIDRARSDIDIGVDRIVVNRMPTRLASDAARDLTDLPSDLELECLPSVPKMRAMLEHSARRDQLAFSQRQRVSSLCSLPVVDLPVQTRGFAAGSGWAEHTEAIVHPAVWPEPAAAQAAEAGIE